MQGPFRISASFAGGNYNGEEVLGLSLTFSKRWITLAPVATAIGLAFKLRGSGRLARRPGHRGIRHYLCPVAS